MYYGSVGGKKRGILDIGGTALKWLFGVSTQSDLIELNTEMEKRGIQQQQIVHLLDKQATIMNKHIKSPTLASC